MYLFQTKNKDNPIPWFTVHFDSSTGLVNALKNSLHGSSTGGMAGVPQNRLLAKLVNLLPQKLELSVYRRGSADKAVPAEKLGEIKAAHFAKWATNEYPRRKYPVIALGSSNGAVVHLCAAMGIPWLPQTFLIPVKTPDYLTIDDPIGRMNWAQEVARPLLNANPDLELHHMMDPNQDRPMLSSISYFRVKFQHLNLPYRQFILNHLEEGGTLLTIECNKRWPATGVDERHYFQFGGLGGTTIHEYFNGSPEVARFLEEQDAPVRKWSPPEPTTEKPEAEWGFVPTLLDDIRRLAKQKNYGVQRLHFSEPHEVNGVVAELYRNWYRRQGITVNRLLAGTFALMAPYLSIRTGTVPYWLPFNAKPSIVHLKNYLQKADPYDEIFVMPFSNGIRGQGQATEKDYQTVFGLAKNGGDYLGADPEVYPFDFGIYARYEQDIKERFTERFRMKNRLTLADLAAFLSKPEQSATVQLLQDLPGPYMA